MMNELADDYTAAEEIPVVIRFSLSKTRTSYVMVMSFCQFGTYYQGLEL
jgi:hypothetical protein